MVYKTPEKPEFLKMGECLSVISWRQSLWLNIMWKKQDTKIYLSMKTWMFEKRSKNIIYAPEERSSRNWTNIFKWLYLGDRIKRALKKKNLVPSSVFSFINMLLSSFLSLRVTQLKQGNILSLRTSPSSGVNLFHFLSRMYSQGLPAFLHRGRGFDPWWRS